VTIELINRNLSCVIAPELGASVMRLDILKRGVSIPVLTPTPEDCTDPRLFALTHLAPICGPVRNNSFKWDGKPKDLLPSFADEKLYRNGIAWQRPWVGKKDSRNAATCVYTHKKAEGWPFDFTIRTIFDLEEDNLTITYEFANESKQGAHPVGFGSSLRIPKSNKMLLSAKISSIWTNDADGVPLTNGEAPFNLDLKEGLEILGLDTPERWYSGWIGKATLDYAESKLSLTIKAGDPFTHLGFACRKDDDFLRFSTLSHVPGVLDIKGYDEDETGMRIIGPGESLTGQIKIDVDLSAY
jgi:aldose 1-epimerase